MKIRFIKNVKNQILSNDIFIIKTHDMKKVVKLNEATLKRIVKNVLMEAVDGGWEVPDGMAQEAYDLAVQYFGKEDIDDQIVQSIGNEQLAKCLAFIFRMNDFREWYRYMEKKQNGGDEYGFEDDEE